jgi:hypothetical protein
MTDTTTPASPAGGRALARRALLLPALILGAALGAPVGLAAQSGGVSHDDGPPVVETRIVVRALSNDAKLIGSGVGGARITIRHAETGAVLAEGIQTGGTGDTEAILAPRARDDNPFATEGAAAFRTSLPLDRATPVEIVAEGPLGTPHAAQRASTTLLLLPGGHIDGDGVILVLHGFTVEVMAAPGRVRPGDVLPVRARVTMLCGCPTEPGGRWDSTAWQMRAVLEGPDGPLATAPLGFTGTTSEYEAVLELPRELPEGLHTLRITVLDAGRVNAGMVERAVRVAR